MTEHKHKHLTALQKRLAIGGVVFFALVFWVIISGLVYEKIYYDKIYPGLRFAGQNIGGLRSADFREFLNAKAKLFDNGVDVCLEGDCFNVKSASSTLSAAQVDLFTINTDETFNQAFSFGRQGDFGQNLWDNITSLFYAKQLNFSVRLDQEGMAEVLKNYFDYGAKEVKEADLTLNQAGELALVAEADGWEPDYQRAVKELAEELELGTNKKINLEIKKIKPTIHQAEIVNLNEQASDLLKNFPITWHYQDKSWSVTSSTAKAWLGLGLNQVSKAEVIFSKDKVQKYLSDKISPDITVPLVDPKFTVDNGRVYIEESAQDGLEINYEATLINFFTGLAQGTKDLELAVQKTTSQAKGLDGLEQLEIVGVGTSTFSGSPANRRVNIKVGAKAINGLMIKPGEEFSLIKALGTIDGSTGYLQELVIKENKTTPEYGGGLCQIGTTLFRAVVASGLPVTERRNHSYRVAYYEPAGTDATIYDPKPDFRFVNDTGSPLLLQTVISGDKATFTFWGKRDGRQVVHTYPTIYNIVKPGPTKIVETTTLKPGEKKCTEKAHNGADAYFDYAVTYPSGEEKKVRFSSHYVPWREVCLVGVAATSTPSGVPADSEKVISDSNIDSSKFDANTHQKNF